MCRQLTPSGREARPEPDHHVRRERDADLLADDEADEHAQGDRLEQHRSRGRRASATPALASANRGTIRKATHGWSACSIRSIGACAFSVASSSSHSAAWCSSMLACPPRPVRPSKSSSGGACPRDEGVVVEAGARRDRERQQHPGDRGMDTRLVHGQPERDAEHAVDHRAPRAEAVGGDEGERGRPPPQPARAATVRPCRRAR